MIVPDNLDAFVKATASLPLTTPTSVAPIPTVIPNLPIFLDHHDTGKRTLWYVRSPLSSPDLLDFFWQSSLLSHLRIIVLDSH